MGERSEQLRVGVVGLGSMGHNHARNAESVGHSVVGGADIIGEARTGFGVEFDTDTYETHDALYEEEDLDAAFITTPNKFHRDAAVAAFERDINVLCEKPLANTLDAAREIASAAADSEGFGMVGFHNRFSTAATVFDDYRRSGRFGDLTHIDVNYVRRRGIPGGRGWFTNHELSGGGALIDVGVHAVDYALYLAGYPEVTEVSGTTRTTFNYDSYANPEGFFGEWDMANQDFNVDDSASAFIRTEGPTISLEVTWAANREPTRNVHVDGTAAGAKIDRMGGSSMTVYEASKSGTDHFVDSSIDGELDPAGHEAQDEYFLDTVATDGVPEMNTIEQGLIVQRVIDAIYRSSASGKAVEP